MLKALNLVNRSERPGSAAAAWCVVLLVVRVVETLRALVLEERLEVDVAGRITERHEVVSVPDRRASSTGSVAVLRVVQREALRLGLRRWQAD